MLSIDNLKSKYDVGVIRVEDYLKYKKIKEDWIKSIIVFIFPYQYKNETGNYLTAKFAYGRDYHLVLKEHLTKVANELKLNRYQVMVDVSYIDEKLAASLAGLGSIGKNTLLITPKYGTYVVIGEIVTDEVFDKYDQPITSLCVDCDLCIKKCPVQALDNGFDKKRCLSYLTQSASKNFELYDNIKNVCYGCDICQDVCIHNKKHKEYEYLNDFKYNQDSNINLNILKKLDNDKYQELYKDKTFNWIGYLKMLRNIIVLEVNNNNISIDDLNYYQKKYKQYPWFYDHIEYLKGKLKHD